MEFEPTYKCLFEEIPELWGNNLQRELEDMCTLAKMQTRKREGRSKSLEDFNLNMVKLKVKFLHERPWTMGGSSEIFYMRASIIFVNSTDGNAYNYQEVERELAVKKLKEEYK